MRRAEHDTLLGIALLVIGLALLIAARIAWSAPPQLSTQQKQALVQAYQAGYHYQIPLVFAAVVYVESSLCANVGNHAAKGCAQIQHAAAVEAAGFDIPRWRYTGAAFTDVNLALGAKYLTQCLDRFGWPAGVGCYRVGPTAAAKLGRKKLAGLAYTRSVLAAMTWLRDLPVSYD